jgi:hypothetical protein
MPVMIEKDTPCPGLPLPPGDEFEVVFLRPNAGAYGRKARGDCAVVDRATAQSLLSRTRPLAMLRLPGIDPGECVTLGEQGILTPAMLAAANKAAAGGADSPMENQLAGAGIDAHDAALLADLGIASIEELRALGSEVLGEKDPGLSAGAVAIIENLTAADPGGDG